MGSLKIGWKHSTNNVSKDVVSLWQSLHCLICHQATQGSFESLHTQDNLRQRCNILTNIAGCFLKRLQYLYYGLYNAPLLCENEPPKSICVPMAVLALLCSGSRWSMWNGEFTWWRHHAPGHSQAGQSPRGFRSGFVRAINKCCDFPAGGDGTANSLALFQSI